MIGRRAVLLGAASLAGAPCQAWAVPARDLVAIERETGGRLGVAALDVATGARLAYRAEERFPLCSTFKLLAAAAILARVDRGEERLDTRVRYGLEDLVTYSPETEKHVGGDGMTIAAICAAAIALSDNTAGNLMLARIGGPAGLTAFLRGQGDEVGRLDRTEPTLNEALPGDPRDTTSPAAMVADMQRLLIADALSTKSRAQLAEWLLGSRTGDARLKAGMPPGSRVGDKTGSGERGTANDVAIAWPPRGGPWIVAAYLTGSPASPEARSAALAAVGRAVTAAFG